MFTVQRSSYQQAGCARPPQSQGKIERKRKWIGFERAWTSQHADSASHGPPQTLSALFWLAAVFVILSHME